MSRTGIIGFVIFFFLLIVLQVMLFDKIHLFGYATPLLSVYFLIKLPAEINRSLSLLLAAALGLTLDFLTGTLGLNLLACVVLAFLRPAILRIYAQRDHFGDYIPSYSSLNSRAMIFYTLFMTFLHHTLIFSVESFSLFHFWNLILRIVTSVILTGLIILACESLRLNWFD